jgi:hypothetical protein
VLPFTVLGAVSFLALGAALLGWSSGPTPAAINLQIALARTAIEPSFAFHVADHNINTLNGFTYSGHDVNGRWQAPDRVVVTSVPADGGQTATVIAIGTAEYVTGIAGLQGRSQIEPYQSDPFLVNAPTLSALPPFGMVASADDVTQHGDTYDFTVPTIGLPYGWVAYAPLSKSGTRASIPEGPDTPTYPQARNTRMRAVVKDGIIVSLSLPTGISGPHTHLGGPEVWTVSHIGSTAPIRLPAADALTCHSGSVRLSASLAAAPASLCVYLGTTVTITFDSRRGGIGEAGPWATPSVMVEHPSILSPTSQEMHGHQLTARFVAAGLGATEISASFDEECTASEQSPPCTIPPQSSITVKVMVHGR